MPIAFDTVTSKLSVPVITGVWTVMLASNANVIVLAPALLSIINWNDVPLPVPPPNAVLIPVAVGVVMVTSPTLV